MSNRPTAADFLRISERIRVLPIVHGSGDFAVRVRAELLDQPFDCLAVPLPPSFQSDVEEAIGELPTISCVVQQDANVPDDGEEGFSFVPIDPCQGVIAAIRLALGERIPRAFIDLETPYFEPMSASFPDPYALKRVSIAGFAAAVLPYIPPPEEGQHLDRIQWMARRLRDLESKYRQIVLVCSLLDWPWIRQAYTQNAEPTEPDTFYAPIATFPVAERTLAFVLGELPFITSLYERGRIELSDDENLSVDGVKELLIAAREELRKTHPRTAARITPQLLAIYLRYVRNLSLLGRRLTPDLHTLVTAAQQTAGDDFALAVAETARQYAPSWKDEGGRMKDEEEEEEGEKEEEEDAEDADPDSDSSFILPPSSFRLRMGIDSAEVPGWGTGPMANRLPGQSITWGTIRLRRRPDRRDQENWKQQWNPHGQCSWPPEDERIESFTAHVRDQAKAILGADLARSEKFTTSVMDGLDIRETLRHWHTGDIYVKVIPPSRGSIEIVVFLFDADPDPVRYPFRTTWFAEHQNESTLAFYATNPLEDLVGPGIARAEYGGAMFLYPPRSIPDVWTDPWLGFVDTLEERLLAAAFAHSNERHVAVVSPCPPRASWRRLARRMGRKIVHLPMKRFSGQLLERLRTLHVLNGKEVRSYAAEFIRDQ